MPIKPYEPTPEDIQWLQTNVRLLRDGGVLGMPSSGMIYQVDKVRQALVLKAPAWDSTPTTMLLHHRNDCVCRAIGWKIEPAVDWEAL